MPGYRRARLHEFRLNDILIMPRKPRSAADLSATRVFRSSSILVGTGLRRDIEIAHIRLGLLLIHASRYDI